ncbi:MAG: cupin domain-containing protein [Cellulosilyticaceae bacterium]
MIEKYLTKIEEVALEIIEEGLVSRKILAYGGGLMTVQVIFNEGAVGSAHTHEHEQISYCEEGSFEYYIGEEKCILNVGDSIYIPANAVHGCKLLSQKGRLLDVFTPQRADFLK